MTYTKAFSEDKYSEIESALSQLPGLEAGGEVSISNLNTHEMAHVRWLVYDYLHHMGAKTRFRVKTDFDRKAIVIRRIGLSSVPQIQVNRSGLPSGLAKILEDLVAIDNLSQAETKLAELTEGGKISAGEFGQLLLELRRVMS